MKKRNGKAFKKILGAAAIATSLLIGMTAACSSSSDDNNDDENTTPSKLDTQVIKNGNFEFYDNGKGLYPISTPDSWSYSTSGNSSASMSGVIDTSKKGWDYLTDESLPATLEANDDLENDDENKKNYNGALTDDMLYANTHDAVKSDATPEQKAYISNPFTHKYALDDDGKVIDAEGNAVTTYADEDGKLFLDEDLKEPVETSILMLHNYRSESDYKGTESYYKSSTTVTLEASTACKISVWVKTDNLYFDGATNSRTEATSERGAYIKLSTQVGGNSINDVVIKNINTQQLLKTDDENAKPANNGWVQYTLYVEASTFASTTVNVTLGLGESGVYTVEGYAFFDDLEYTKYKNSAEMIADNPDFDSKKNEGNTNVTQPLAPDADTKFRVDKVTYQTNNTDGSLEPVVKEYNSADRHFYVDFTKSSNDPDNWDLNGSITAGLTVDKTSQGNFVSVLPKDLGSNTITTKKFGDDYYKSVNLPTALKTNGLSVKDDLITVVPVTDEENWQFKDGYKYNDTLTKALKSAATLPGANGSTDAFVIVSADGAAYEAHIEDNKFTLNDGEYALVSFWMKPSEIKGGNAVSVNVVDVDDEDNKGSSFGLSTASITPVNIGDDKDIYDGWVQCFVRVANTSKEDGKKFKIVVNFGNTSISGTSKTSYNAGWVALSNVSVMNLDEDVYGYTSGGSFTTTLSFTEDTQKGTHVFDTAEEGIHKEALAKPSKYNGYNGASINIEANGDKEATEYDAANQNKFAGLIKKENLSTYIESQSEHSEWLSKLKFIENLTSDDPDTIWNKFFDSYAIQPLLIVNTARKINEKEQIYNYGYVGSSSSVSENGAVAVSVRVKASAGAIANIYLVEDKENNRNLLNYELPEYTFWYDDDGNILKGEPDEDATVAEKKENIAYTLRKDGLYENGDGKLYANLYNLSKYYDALWYENEEFYDAEHNPVSFTVVKKNQGKDYFNKDGSAFAPHHLIAGGEENNKVYEYAGRDEKGDYYYYIEDETPNKDKVVYAIDKELATVRYESKTEDNTPYQFTIDTNKTPELAGKWVTVTFYIRTGVESKNYRLELWSGSRDKETDYENATKDSYVVFDYSGLGASLDDSKFTAALDEYTKLITDGYKSRLTDELESNDLTIAELEKLASEEIKNQVKEDFDYTAKHYSFSLFDSTAFIPFNGETADENQTGYSFNYSDYDESLAYLKIVDDSDENNITFSSFIDYSVVDKDFDIIGAPQAPYSSTDDDHTHDDEDGDANFWLLIASIVLVAAIMLAAVVIFIRSVVLKRIRRKTAGKNSYNFNKNKRYVKKYVKANGEAPAIEEGEVDESLLSDQPEEEAEPTAEETAEEPAVEEPPSEGGEEKPDDGENK